MHYIIIYLVSIVTANLLVLHFGPSAAIINAFVLIGLDLTLRDKLHDNWRKEGKLVIKMSLMIAAGSLLSWVLNRDAGRIATASFIAFASASTVDTIVYHVMRKKPILLKINVSNLFSAFTDSIVFPTIAFGSILPAIIAGQFFAKVLGGFVWSLLLRHLMNVSKDRNNTAPGVVSAT